MQIYQKKKSWKLFLFLFATVIAAASLLYTNYLVKKLAIEEKKRVEIWANATRLFSTVEDSETLSFLFMVSSENSTIPIILADSLDNVVGFKNLDSAKLENKDYLKKVLTQMKEENPAIEIKTPYFTQYVYYQNSILLTQLKYYPFIQLSIIFVFLTISYLAFSSSRRAEQNRVWVGMSKETAHQLGTPISSLMAWVEHLREKWKGDNTEVLEEMEKDIGRLEVITERFSKIGSDPDLTEVNVKEVLENYVDYLSKRSSKEVVFNVTGQAANVKINIHLFDWVIENLCKNAINAMGGKGRIDLNIGVNGKWVFIDIKDSGKGIPKSKFETVFDPGYTTKKRGWGLGLSLSKRIIQEYHKGKLFVKWSEIDKGSTFRIELKSA